MALVLTFGRQRQADCWEFKVSRIYVGSPRAARDTS